MPINPGSTALGGGIITAPHHPVVTGKKNPYYNPPTAPAGGSNGLSDYYAYLMAQNAAARQAALKGIRDRLNANIDNYNMQMAASDADYQSLINQSEVNRFRDARAVRENQSNRGVMDSGLGRQEQLNLATASSNRLSNIKTEREAARNTIRNKINELKAQAELDKANVNDKYNELAMKYI